MSLPAKESAFAKVPPATSPTSTGTPEVQTGNAHKMEYQETVPLQLLSQTLVQMLFPHGALYGSSAITFVGIQFPFLAELCMAAPARS